ncbi:conserved hypothetical protein [Verticillium alfalfae VaMs.102]|uniref:Uncharacterized protein n=1 Tax=Verticillium alfalfae (strain VaMs.102 / ATCC MYA-4576 / FGSC 10136) TaxID=526221 RepID=C9SUP8_VERA1|nr:conserved hypothetical protein [Verticillium alfalfae VaMs.102]EEY22513.1 conserved hypothetical protein [Verticillium alfalfae VaMs.102]
MSMYQSPASWYNSGPSRSIYYEQIRLIDATQLRSTQPGNPGNDPGGQFNSSGANKKSRCVFTHALRPHSVHLDQLYLCPQLFFAGPLARSYEPDDKPQRWTWLHPSWLKAAVGKSAIPYYAGSCVFVRIRELSYEWLR